MSRAAAPGGTRRGAGGTAPGAGVAGSPWAAGGHRAGSREGAAGIPAAAGDRGLKSHNTVEKHSGKGALNTDCCTGLDSSAPGAGDTTSSVI